MLSMYVMKSHVPDKRFIGTLSPSVDNYVCHSLVTNSWCVQSAWNLEPGDVYSVLCVMGEPTTHEVPLRLTLFTAPGATDCLTAVILDPETVFQQDSNGTPFPEVLSKQGLIPGVKPSLTVYKLPGTAGETTMQGLDGLSERCAKYYAAGCRFAKWRSPLTIDVAAGTPSALAIETNCRDLARYALICQAEGLVPIVEPDLVLKGAHVVQRLREAVDQVRRG